MTPRSVVIERVSEEGATRTKQTLVVEEPGAACRQLRALASVVSAPACWYVVEGTERDEDRAS